MRGVLSVRLVERINSVYRILPLTGYWSFPDVNGVVVDA